MASRNRPRPASGRRPPYGPRTPVERRPDAFFIYGIHPVLAALANPRRAVKRVMATPNALARLKAAGARLPVEPEEASPRDLDRLLGGEAVHQGVALEVAPLEPPGIETLSGKRLVVCLDQVSDPHNVGAMLRSAAAFGADALLSTARHAPSESGVLAKAASGALDLIPLVFVPNLARALDQLAAYGFTRIGLDETCEEAIEMAMDGDRIALVMGAEGRGMRRLTRDRCDRLARLPTGGALASLNVSNAAAVALYVARRHLDGSG